MMWCGWLPVTSFRCLTESSQTESQSNQKQKCESKQERKAKQNQNASYRCALEKLSKAVRKASLKRWEASVSASCFLKFPRAMTFYHIRFAKSIGSWTQKEALQFRSFAETEGSWGTQWL